MRKSSIAALLALCGSHAPAFASPFDAGNFVFVGDDITFATSMIGGIGINDWAELEVTLDAPGSDQPRQTRQAGPQGALAGQPNFTVSYQQPGRYEVSADITVSARFETRCVDFIDPSEICRRPQTTIVALDPPQAFSATDTLLVAPEAFRGVDEFFVIEPGQSLVPDFSFVEFGSTTPVGFVSGSDRYSYELNGQDYDGTPITFDTPGQYVLDWSGTTWDSYARFIADECVNPGVPSPVCREVIRVEPNLTLQDYTWGVLVEGEVPAPVPLPASGWLLMAAIAGMIVRGRARGASVRAVAPVADAR